MLLNILQKFFCTQLIFTFYFQKGFCIFHDHIVTFLLSLFQEDSDIFEEPFLAGIFYFFDNTLLMDRETLT